MQPHIDTHTSSTTRTRDVRIRQSHPLISPAQLRQELPLPDTAARSVLAARSRIGAVLDQRDDRLLVIAGPCSIHDPAAGKEYAHRLARVADELSEDLLIVMRSYFEKPRTTLGWKGLINDPHLDGSYDVNTGLRTARRFLLDILDLGLPAGCEFLDPVSPQHIADLVSWGAIGARTSASQVHRHLASGLSMPVGFKNATSGDVQDAVDALEAAGASHAFAGINEDGVAAILTTDGNPDCHVILRGGHHGPNHDAASVHDTMQRLRKAGQPERVVIDASHGNSGKDHRRQPAVVREIAEQIADGAPAISGLMMESFLVPGRQDLAEGRTDNLVHGQSITDACLGWETTEALLHELAGAVAARRSHVG